MTCPRRVAVEDRHMTACSIILEVEGATIPFVDQSRHSTRWERLSVGPIEEGRSSVVLDLPGEIGVPLLEDGQGYGCFRPTGVSAGIRVPFGLVCMRPREG